jgi:hypothetical protein
MMPIIQSLSLSLPPLFLSLSLPLNAFGVPFLTMVLWQQQQQQQYQGYHEVDNKTARKERGGREREEG